MNRITLRQLEYFIAVGKAGSIARAAEAVNVSSPSISAAIAALEEELGLSLFVRRRARGLSLSAAGRQVMERAEAVVKEAGALTRLAADIAGSVQGPLAVGCLVSFAQVLVPGLRRGFEERHPEVNVTQAELDQQGIFSGLREARIDLALTYDMNIPSDLEFAPLVPLPPYAMVAQDHPLAQRAEVRLEDLAELPMILLDLPHSAEYFLSIFSEAGLRPRIAERTRDMGSLRSLVANGFGFGIANIRPAHGLAPDGKRLGFVPIADAKRIMELGVVMPPGAAERSPTVRAFVEHARREIGAARIPGIMGLEEPA